MSDQTTGQVLAVTGGGTTAQHPMVATHEVLVAPTTVDEHNTIRAAILPFACWRCDDIRFDFDSSFVRPEIADELGALAALRKQHPGAPISIFGHADPVGDDVYNKQLSGRRATVIYGLLIRDTGLWESLYQQEHWDARTIQTTLATIERSTPKTPESSPAGSPNVEQGTTIGRESPAGGYGNHASPYYTYAIDGYAGSQTRASVKDFQSDRGLASDGVIGPNTRRELFLAYMDAICRDQGGLPFSLDRQNDFLARGEDSGGKGDYQGCSEFNPKLIFSQEEEHKFKQYGHREERNAENAPNRRVIAFMFRPGVKVSTDFWPCPRVKEGISACKRRFWSNGEYRRAHHLSSERREFDRTEDTFACRFYHRMAVKSPCEGVMHRFIFRYALQNDESVSWSDQAWLRIVSEDGKQKKLFLMSQGEQVGTCRSFMFDQIRPGVRYRCEIDDGGMQVELFGPSELFRIQDPNDEVNIVAVPEVEEPAEESSGESIQTHQPFGFVDGFIDGDEGVDQAAVATAADPYRGPSITE